VCIVAVGITALWTFAGEETPSEETPQVNEPVQEKEDSELPDYHQTDYYEPKGNGVQTDAGGDATPYVVDGLVGGELREDTVIVKDIAKEEVVTKGGVPIAFPVLKHQIPEGITMYKPVEGEVLKNFSLNELLYCRTLKQWSTHPGMDIEADSGSEVKAAMAGIVTDISEDPLMGIVITLDHGDGIKTRYANLSTADMVGLGQEVEGGQVISGVGRTAIASILYPPHLHFEVLFNGTNIDPKYFIE
jgi:murein DD-endopeptidase MepM/ murein hydrolase activator NlpD